MDNRVSVISIIIKEEESIGAVNELLHEFREYIVGRMGIPYQVLFLKFCHDLSYPCRVGTDVFRKLFAGEHGILMMPISRRWH